MSPEKLNVPIAVDLPPRSYALETKFAATGCWAAPPKPAKNVMTNKVRIDGANVINITPPATHTLPINSNQLPLNNSANKPIGIWNTAEAPVNKPLQELPQYTKGLDQLL
jgi:hypothetical protein